MKELKKKKKENMFIVKSMLILPCLLTFLSFRDWEWTVGIYQKKKKKHYPLIALLECILRMSSNTVLL